MDCHDKKTNEEFLEEKSMEFSRTTSLLLHLETT